MVSSVVSTLSIFLPAPTVVMTSAALSTSTTTHGLNIIRGKLSYLDTPGSSGIEGPANLRVDVFAVFVRCKGEPLRRPDNFEIRKVCDAKFKLRSLDRTRDLGSAIINATRRLTMFTAI
jgi:hypothetical protein